MITDTDFAHMSSQLVAGPESKEPKALDVAPLLLVVLLDVDADEHAVAVGLVVDATHVFAASDSGGKLGGLAPASHSLEVLADCLSSVDLNEAPDNRGRRV